MKKGLFHFKHFSVNHDRSSMKVGVDGVLIGSWCSAVGERILDAGTGCGVIALMLAQRNPEAEIHAIDVDTCSIEEASENFNNSSWKSRIYSKCISFNDIVEKEKESFDLIVSNPPFYDSGVSAPSTSREVARHQSSFSPSVLIEGASLLLRNHGRVAMIVPSEYFTHLRELGISKGLVLDRAVYVRNKASNAVKRVMMEFCKNSDIIISGNVLDKGKVPVLTMFDSNGEPTPEYQELGKEFYLKF